MLKTHFIYFVLISILFVNMGCQNKAASHLPILYYSGEATAIARNEPERKCCTTLGANVNIIST